MLFTRLGRYHNRLERSKPTSIPWNKSSIPWFFSTKRFTTFAPSDREVVPVILGYSTGWTPSSRNRFGVGALYTVRTGWCLGNMVEVSELVYHWALNNREAAVPNVTKSGAVLGICSSVAPLLKEMNLAMNPPPKPNDVRPLAWIGEKIDSLSALTKKWRSDMTDAEVDALVAQVHTALFDKFGKNYLDILPRSTPSPSRL